MSKSIDKFEKFMLSQMSRDPVEVAKTTAITNNFVAFGKEKAAGQVMNLALQEAELVAQLKSKRVAAARIAKIQTLISEMQEDWVSFSKGMKSIK